MAKPGKVTIGPTTRRPRGGSKPLAQKANVGSSNLGRGKGGMGLKRGSAQKQALGKVTRAATRAGTAVNIKQGQRAVVKLAGQAGISYAKAAKGIGKQGGMNARQARAIGGGSTD